MYCHFPGDPESGYDDRYFQMLTAEKVIVKHKAGVPYRVWDAKGRRNESLDCRVYNMAALKILNPNYDRIEENMVVKPVKEKKTPHSQRTRPKYQRRPKQNFVNSWKK